MVMIALGTTVEIGWVTEKYALVQILPHLPYMVKNTAACFILSGFALLTVVLRGPRWLIVLFAGSVSVLCIITIFEYASGINLRTGELLGPTRVSVRSRTPGASRRWQRSASRWPIWDCCLRPEFCQNDLRWFWGSMVRSLQLLELRPLLEFGATPPSRHFIPPSVSPCLGLACYH